MTAQVGGYDARLYPELAALEAGHFWFRARNALIIRAARRFCPAPSRILEIGCGTGFVLAALAAAYPDAELTGSELFADGLGFTAARVPGAMPVQTDARALPFAPRFDLVGAFDVIEHIPEDERVLSEVHGVLRPGGILMLTVPQHPWLWSAADEAACHVRRYRAAELRRKTRAAGFRVLYETSFVSLLLPLLAARRRAGPRDADPRDELNLGRAANAVLGAVMTVERGLLGTGLRFPCGGSRLLVAQREENP